jgi:hypothetical protein
VTIYPEIKHFGLANAPVFIRDASGIDATPIWAAFVGTDGCQDTADAWAVHRWLREGGAVDGERVLASLDKDAAPNAP